MLHSVNDAAERPEVRAAFDTAEALRAAYVELENLRGQAESLNQSLALTTQENENLLVQLRRMKGERDHYFRSFTALSSQIEGLGSAFLKAVEMAKVHSYGERGAPPEGDMPSIVRMAPAMRGSPVRVT